ncbi:MAG: chloride channel protein [bacterium]
MPNPTGRTRSSRFRQLVFRLLDRFALDETTILVITALVVGIVGGFGAILFRWLVQFFQGFAIGKGEHTVELLAQLPWWHKLLLPLAGGIVVGPLVHFLAREAKGHGVPEVINAVVFKNGVIRPIVAAVKIIASAITIAFGGSVGREGPIIQIGAAMASSLGQWLRYSPQRLRTLIGCGAAAGIAATFNAPIAGAFFALEIILRDFAIRTFSPIIVSSVVATAVSRQFLGDTPAFPVPGFSIHSWAELPFYVVLGVFAAAVAVAYVRSLYATEDGFERIKLPPYLKPPLGGLFLGLLFLWFPQVYGIGYESMVQALNGDIVWQLMLVLVVVKLIAVNLTLGAGFSGGIFAPALFLGGMLGGAYGALVGELFPANAGAVGAYALVGMAALVAAATGGPLMAILILFEMTGEYRIILPLMLACITATLVFRRWMSDTIFTLKFTRQGQQLEFGRESAILKNFHVQDIMEANPPTIPIGYTLDKILKLFLSNQDSHYYVVESDHRLVGAITIHDVKDILHTESLGKVVVAADLCLPVDRFVYQRDNLEDCLLLLGQEDVNDLPVLASPERPVLVGIITRHAIFEIYNREVLQQEDAGIKLVHGESRLHDCVELPETYRVQLLTLPGSYLGHSLRELSLRQRFGVSVLVVKRRGWRGEAKNELPDPDRPLQAHDRIIVVAHVDDLERLLDEVERDDFTV